MAESLSICLENVCKSYPEGARRRQVLDDVSIRLPAGELIAVRGRSGSGKSTLLNLLAGIDLPDSGRVQIDGQIINSLNERDRTMLRRRHIGFVFQAFNLIPTLSVAENLRFPLELNGVDQNTANVRTAELLDQLGLATRGDSFPDQLSGGEKQRVAIARAIVHRPRIVLADEPTGNLDQTTEQTILELLHALPGRFGVTVIAATHSRHIAAGADRILTLERGKLHA